MSSRRVFASVLAFLVAAGWAANHFASVIVLLREELNLSALLVNGAYGIYALGLLPSLLVGGVLADRFGGRPVVITGSTIALLGNLALMMFHGPAGLLVGRLIVGLGVGLVVSPGTAWAARLRGAGGATVAGIALTSGFAIGPVVSGAVATFSAPIWLPFALSIAASIAAIAFSATTGDLPLGATGVQEGAPTPLEPGASPGKALATAVPVAMWVFAAIISSVVVLASRVSGYFSTGVFLPGVAAVCGFGAGMIVQALGRAYNWGPLSGVVGIVLATGGFLLVAAGGQEPSLLLFFVATVLLGGAYGLCLRDGLLDVNAYSPPAYRGRVLGAYYAATYIGFGLPPLLESIEPYTGPTLPYFVLAGGAAAAALLRTWQIHSGYLARA